MGFELAFLLTFCCVVFAAILAALSPVYPNSAHHFLAFHTCIGMFVPIFKGQTIAQVVDKPWRAVSPRDSAIAREHTPPLYLQMRVSVLGESN